MKHNESNQSERKDTVDISEVVSRTLTDLQVMLESYEEGTKSLENVPETCHLTHGLELVKSGLVIHRSLLHFLTEYFDGTSDQVGDDGNDSFDQDLTEDQDSPPPFHENEVFENTLVKVESEFEPDFNRDDSFITEEENSQQATNSCNPETGENFHKCGTCSKEFTSYPNLKRHMSAVHRSHDVKCDKCGDSFPRKSFLTKHLNLKCGKMDQDSENQGNNKHSLDNTVLDKKTKGKKLKDPDLFKFKCNLCDERYARECSLIKHHKIKHRPSSPNVKCNICSASFKRDTELELHLNMEHPNSQTLNNAVKFKSSTELDISSDVNKAGERKHLRNNVSVIKLNPMVNEALRGGEDKKTKCPSEAQSEVVGKENKQNVALFSPVEKVNNGVDRKTVQTDKFSFICEDCSETFNDSASLNIHRIKKHTETPFKCEFCPRAYFSQSRLNSHRKNVHVCCVCNQTFAASKLLREHKITQHPELNLDPAPYVCDVCGYSTMYQVSLIRHQIQHTGEKRFQCHLCHDRFTQKVNLTRHLFLHTGEKPHECDRCGRRFRLAVHLTKHYRLHTGEKPFACADCGKRFHLSGERNKHVKKFHHHAKAAPAAAVGGQSELLTAAE